MPVNVVFFGDSVSFGQFMSLHKCWATKVAHKLAYTFGDDAVCVTNSSVNGNTTRQALERMSYDLSGLKPDILTVQFGMNDCNYWATDGGVPRVSAASFEANLKEIFDRAKASGVKQVFFVTNYPTNRPTEYELNNRKYNKVIRRVSTLCEAGLIDVEDHFRHHKVLLDDLLLSDGLHLSQRGHQIYFEFVYPIIKDAVQELV